MLYGLGWEGVWWECEKEYNADSCLMVKVGPEATALYRAWNALPIDQQQRALLDADNIAAHATGSSRDVPAVDQQANDLDIVKEIP